MTAAAPERLIYVAHARLPTEKAHGLQIARMCEAFAGLGHEVCLVKPRRLQPDPSWNEKSVLDHYDISAPFQVHEVPTLDFMIPPRARMGLFGRLWYWLETASFLVGVARWLASNPVRGATLYTRDAPVLILASALKHRFGYRIAYESHQKHSRAASRMARARADLWIALTRRLRDYWHGQGVPAERILIEADAVDASRFAGTPEPAEARRRLALPEGPTIGYIGRFHMMGTDKGVGDLITAFGSVAAEMPDARLLLVGGPVAMIQPVLDRLPKETRRRVTALDYVTPVRIPAHIAACDVCVVPNPQSEHYSDCVSPLKLFEYWAAGRPVVATDLPSLRDVLEPDVNAVLVGPADPKAMAAGLLRILADHPLRTRLGERGRQEAARRSWSARAGRILQAIFHDR